MKDKISSKPDKFAGVLSLYEKKPFFHLFKALIEASGMSSGVVSLKLGYPRDFISRREEKNYLLREAEVAQALTIIGLNGNLASVVKEKWQKNYETEMKRLFANLADRPFPDLLKAARELVGVSSSKMSGELGKYLTFSLQVEEKNAFLPEEFARKVAKLLCLDGFTEEFMSRWKKHYDSWRKLSRKNNGIQADEEKLKDKLSGEHNPGSEPNGDVATPSPKPQATPKKTGKLDGIIEMPLGRLANFLCLRAGLSGGLDNIHKEYLYHGGKTNPFDLSPEADNSSRLSAVCALADRLKLGAKEIHELSTVLYANYPGKYFIAVEGGGMDFFDLAISLAPKALRVSAIKDQV